MKKKATDVTLTVVPKGEFSPTLDQTPLTPANLEQLALDAIADLESFQKHVNQAAFAALRNGARLLAVQHAPGAKRGALSGFVDMLVKRGANRSTLFNHKAIAEEFYERMGWLSDKGKLTDREQPQALLGAQLDLFTDPEAKQRQDAIGEAVRFIGDNGVRDLLKMIAADHAENKTSGQTFGGQLGNTSASVSPAQRRALDMAAAGKMADDITAWLVTDAYHAKDAHKNRKTLEEVAKMERPALTLSLLNSEALTALAKVFEDSQETIKYILLTREGRKVVKRGAKGKGLHS